LDRPTASGCLEKTDTKALFQCTHDPMELMDRESAPPEIRKNQQLEQLDWRVTAFSVATSFGPVRANRGRQEPSGIPHLKLTRRQAGR
jgi:hypothetical protein